MTKIKDLTDEQFGKLHVLRFQGRDDLKNRTWLCRCDCGQERIVRTANLMRGDVTTCGRYECKYDADRFAKRRPPAKVHPPARLTAAQQEQGTAQFEAAIVAAGGYGGENDKRNWRDHRRSA